MGPAATLLRVCAIPLIRKKVLQRCQKKRSESPAIPVAVSQILLFEQPSEKSLSEILRFFGTITFAPDKRIEWIPIHAAQRLKGFARRLTRSFARD